jgi:hypothetical protein
MLKKRPIRRKKLPPGRPKKEVKKDIVIGTRFSKLEQYVVKQKSERAGLKPAEYIRQMAIRGQVKSRMSEEERQIVRQLVGMANNLNQLARQANLQGLMTVVLHFEEYRNRIDELLKVLRNGE